MIQINYIFPVNSGAFALAQLRSFKQIFKGNIFNAILSMHKIYIKYKLDE